MNVNRDGAIDLRDVKYVQDDSDRRVVSGDVLFNNTNSPALVGKTAYVSSAAPLAYSNHMTRLRVPRGDIDPRFLAIQLHSMWDRGYFESICSNHVNQASVSSRRLLEVEIVSPPLAEQRRIVDILEDHLSRLEAAATLALAAETKLDAWRRSCIDRFVWGSATKRAPLSSLLSEPMRNGHSARATHNPDGIRTLTLTAVTRGDFSEKFTKMTNADPRKVAGLWLRRDDILVERSNTPELVGTAAIYNGQDDWAIYPDLVIRVRVDPGRALPSYVAAAIRSERAHRWLRSRAKGLAGSMPKIDQGTIAALELPVLSLDEQQAVVEEVDGVENNHGRLLRESKAARNRAGRVRRSLLLAAFSGRLTGSHTDTEIVEELADV